MNTPNKTTIQLSGEFYTIIRDGGLIRAGGGYALYTSSINDDLCRGDDEIRPLCGRYLFKTKKQAIKMAEQCAERRQQIKAAKKVAEFRALLASVA
tara:strand:+ start:391 stop:678 length:288 start_codon:yes stop_codon:yes gene_type:complete